MCPESFGGVRFDIILCMSCFNHVPPGIHCIEMQSLVDSVFINKSGGGEADESGC